jgi:hypothetical protein
MEPTIELISQEPIDLPVTGHQPLTGKRGAHH